MNPEEIERRELRVVRAEAEAASRDLDREIAARDEFICRAETPELRARRTARHVFGFRETRYNGSCTGLRARALRAEWDRAFTEQAAALGHEPTFEEKCRIQNDLARAVPSKDHD